jgi:hypothetical protein
MAKNDEPKLTRPEQFDLCWQSHNDSLKERGLVLALSAVVEHSLSDLVESQIRAIATDRRRFAGTPDELAAESKKWEAERKQLLGRGDAKVQARFAYVFGLIDRPTFLGLSALFDLRNDFAHWQIPEPLDNDQVAKVVEPLTKVRKPWGIDDPVVQQELANIPAAHQLRAYASHLFTILETVRDRVNQSNLTKSAPPDEP